MRSRHITVSDQSEIKMIVTVGAGTVEPVGGGSSERRFVYGIAGYFGTFQ